MEGARPMSSAVRRLLGRHWRAELISAGHGVPSDSEDSKLISRDRTMSRPTRRPSTTTRGRFVTTDLVPLRMDAQALIQQALDKGASIEVVERMVALAKDVRAEQAKASYFEAMAAFQAECDEIPKSRHADVRTKSGSRYSYNYAALDEIGPIVRPVLAKHGLTLTWRHDQSTDTHAAAVAIVTPKLGHSETSGAVLIPVDQPDSARMNPAQYMGSLLTYARRYSAVAVLGLTPRGEDDDAQGGDDSAEHEDHGDRPARPASSSARLTCPKCGMANVIRSKFGGPNAWWCGERDGGCGAKYILVAGVLKPPPAQGAAPAQEDVPF